MDFITVSQFSELGIEEQSLYVRKIFEHAATNACQYGSDRFNALSDSIDDDGIDCTVVHNDEDYLLVGNEETLRILTSYNESLFPKDEIFSLTGGLCHAIKVTADTLLRYVTAENITKIPNIDTVLSKSGWRKAADAFHYNDRGEPLLVLRPALHSYGGTIQTPSYLYCDATALSNGLFLGPHERFSFNVML